MDRRDRLEFVAVLATAGGHLATLFDKTVHGMFVGIAVIAWAAYVVRVGRRDPERLRRWGFRTDDPLEGGLGPTVAAILAALGMVAWGVATGKSFPWTAALGFLLYPVWGVIQQFLVQALIAAPLDERVGRWWAVACTALLFGLIHVPYVHLMAATFVLGLVFTPLYLRRPNLWFLGLYHGWLGTLFYPMVLGRDPIGEILGL